MPDLVEAVLSKTLVEKGLLSEDALDPVVLKAAQTSGGLASLLVKRGMVEEGVILDILSDHFKLPRVELSTIQVDKAAIDKVLKEEGVCFA